MEDTLFLIPARGGSKGLPGKNVKLFNNKPLIFYSIDYARQFTNDENICVSTDDEATKKIVENYGLQVPFIRPNALATDKTPTMEVIKHALNFYLQKNRSYSKLVLLQPTSPFRDAKHLQEMMNLFHDNLDLVVSVTKLKDNPYFNIYQTNDEGYIEVCIKSNFTRRQDCPEVYKINGNLYLYNVSSVLNINKDNNLSKLVKYEINDPKYNIDIDDIHDWEKAENYI